MTTRKKRRKRQRALNKLAGLFVLAFVAAIVGGGYYLWTSRDTTPPPAPVIVPTQYRAMIKAAGTKCSEITPAVLSAQIEAESAWDEDVVSPSGARGLAQFTDAAWEQWGKDADGDGTSSPLDPADAVDAQSRYMCSLVKRFRGSTFKASGDRVLSLALAGYNAGPENVVAHQGVPPFDETMVYVAKINARLPVHKAAWAEYAAASATRTTAAAG